MMTFRYSLSNKPKKQFNRNLLPSPIAVLSKLNIKPGKVNQKGFWVIRCPFHKEGQEKKPSLNVHQVIGNYLCFACGAKGFDSLHFYRRVTGKNFSNSLIDFGIKG